MTDTNRMIRVDQAGEYGATRIYAGQLAVLGERGPHATEIRGMALQEDGHLERFDALAAARGVRPTALQPFWSVAGYALGAATALIGPEAAMACTAAVEEEIDLSLPDVNDPDEVVTVRGKKAGAAAWEDDDVLDFLKDDKKDAG